jgi:hypothetical protein
MDTTKSQVRSDFKHARELMRQADAFMKDYRHEPGQDFSEFEDMRAVANELIACVATFSQWVEDAQDAAEEAAEEEESSPVSIVAPAPSEDPEVIADRAFEMWVYTR